MLLSGPRCSRYPPSCRPPQAPDLAGALEMGDALVSERNEMLGGLPRTRGVVIDHNIHTRQLGVKRARQHGTAAGAVLIAADSVVVPTTTGPSIRCSSSASTDGRPILQPTAVQPSRRRSRTT